MYTNLFLGNRKFFYCLGNKVKDIDPVRVCVEDCGINQEVHIRLDNRGAFQLGKGKDMGALIIETRHVLYWSDI